MRITPVVLVAFTMLVSCKSSGDLSESDKSILIEVGDQLVTLEEFEFSFNKSHQSDTVRKEDIDEYVRLFTNFKLKVVEAREKGYDTVSTYKNELSQYQEQLKSNYRSSEKLVEILKKEAYSRLQSEIKASHILILVDKNSTPEDTLQAYHRILELKRMAEDTSFENLAQKYSEDPSAKSNAGNLGYFSAFNMLYPFESAAYATMVGQISDPIRTEYGYHIIKVEDKRPSIYRVKLYQVLLKGLTPEAIKSSRDKIFSIQEMLVAGLSPEQIQEAIDQGQYNLQLGPLPELSLSQLPENIKEVVYDLKEKGQVSDPVETPLGWHLFILEEKKPLPPYEEMNQQLDRMVRRADRLSIYENQILDKLKMQYGFQEIKGSEDITALANSNSVNDVSLFVISQDTIRYKEFDQFVKQRGGSARDNQLKVYYHDFQKKRIYDLEDKRIIDENPDLRWLLKEYEEGILLFNIMEDEVWNKAVDDKEGFGRFIAEQEEAISEATETLSRSNSEDILKYQQYLEDQWINRLREKYDVKINQQVLNRAYEELID